MLANVPELYSSEKDEVKKVYAKLQHFSGFMTYYVCEFNKNEDLLFGYMSNNRDPFCSEWGYSNLTELLENNFILDPDFKVTEFQELQLCKY